MTTTERAWAEYRNVAGTPPIQKAHALAAIAQAEALERIADSLDVIRGAFSDGPDGYLFVKAEQR